MGNEQSSNPIRNMDKRTARREHGEAFKSAIQNYRRNIGFNLKNQVEYKDDEDEWEAGAIRVCVRKRPIFKPELANFEFDVITCVDGANVVVHDARMGKDMRQMMLNHHSFSFDRIFNEKCNNDEVYEQTAAPLLDISLNGGFATCLMYGQTGSGKTYTMSSIYEKAAHELFESIDPETTSVSMSFVELAGDTCSDLLNAFTPAQLLTGQDGGVYAFPIVEPEVNSEEELIAFINHGCNVRTTAATGVNDTSSRSHAILRIYILNKQNNKEGVLTLVDLAGSEHRIDSMYHSAERRKEGAGINASLMALKEVLRAKASKKDASFFYRKSKLTMALKSSFSDPSSRTVVIVTASPASKDTEHSLNSLRHACIMSGQDPSASSGGETRFVTGGRTTVEHIGEVDVAGIAKENHKKIKSGRGMDDLKTSNGNTASSSSSTFGSAVASQELSKDEETKRRLRARRASERKAIALLTKDQKYALQDARDQLGVNKRQQLRLRRVQQQQISQKKQSHQESSPPPPQEQYDEPEEYCITKEQYMASRGQEGGVDVLTTDEPLAFVVAPDPPPRDPLAKSKPKSTGPVRKKVSKIRDMIFSDEYTPVEIKYKQFRAQLKKNGYTKEEIDSILAAEGGNASGQVEQAQPTRSQGHPASRLAHSPVQSNPQSTVAQTSYQATGHGRPLAHSPPPSARDTHHIQQASRRPPVQNSPRQPPVQNSPPRRQGHLEPPSRFDAGAFSSPPPPKMSRAEAARERRLQQEAAQQEARRNKIAQKSNNTAQAVKATATGDSRAIAQLEQQLTQPDLTAATKHAIKKKIAAHRAVLVREERKRNQEKRTAQEASRRQQQTAKKELSFTDETDVNAMPPPMKQDPPLANQAHAMRNTANIESVLSPRDEKTRNARSFSPLQNNRYTHQASPPQPPVAPHQMHQAVHHVQQEYYQQPTMQQPAQQQYHPSLQEQYQQQPPQNHFQQGGQQPPYEDSNNTYTQYKQMKSYAQGQQQRAQQQQPPFQTHDFNQAAPQRQQGHLQQQPMQTATLGDDSLDSLRLHAEQVVRSPPLGAQRQVYRGHAGAGGMHDGSTSYRTRSGGGYGGGAAYTSPFATEMNYMTAKDSPY